MYGLDRWSEVGRNLCYEFVAQTSGMTYKLVSGVYTDDRVINMSREPEGR